MNLTPRRGFVPPNMAIQPYVANELCRILQENESLRRYPNAIEHNKENYGGLYAFKTR